MARRNQSARAGLLNIGGTTLNLTPLLDIIFNLVFFFLLATNIRDRERFLEIALPESETAEAQAVEETIPEIAITRSGELYLDGEAVAEEALGQRLRELVEKGAATEVVLSSDAEVAWQRIVDVTDICRTAGLREVTPRIRSRTE
jgi:biopolymer transport protein ExbD